MNINDAYPSKYLKAADLGGKTPTVTVAHVAIEPVGKTQEMKPVVYFEGKEKGIVCNRTNAKVLTQLAGTAETDEWGGIQVQLFTVQTEFNGDVVDAIRMRMPKGGRPSNLPPAAAPKPAPVQPEPTFQAEPEDVPF